VLLGACEDDPTGVTPEPNAPDTQVSLDEIYDVAVETNLQYGSAPDETGAEEALLLDLHQPQDDGQGLRPAILWLHGGSFQTGHKGHMTDFAWRTARRGYVAATANYRLRENADFDYTRPDDEVGMEAKRDAQQDVKAAVEWLRANAETYRIDPDRIYLAGYSAGATAGLRMAARSGDEDAGDPGIEAVVAIAGYLDEGVLENGGPTLLIHGDADTKVPLARMQEPCDAVETCELVVIPGAGHAMVPAEAEAILTEAVRYLHARVTGS
jgi:acetyl esterase/lipase